MDTLGDVKAQIRSLLDDTDATYTDDAFLLPKIQRKYRQYETRLTATESPYEENVVEIIGLQPGTTDLSAQQGSGGQLFLLNQPTRIDWKLSGADVSQYIEVPLYDVLPDVDPLNLVAGWEWRSRIIQLTPALVAVDLRVRGEFEVAPLTDDSQVLALHPDIGTALSYGVARLVAITLGNPQWATDFGLLEEESLEDIEGQMTRAEQGKVRRVGRQTGRRTYGNRIGFPN